MEKGAILETIAKEMQTGVLVLDKEGRALYANPFLLSAFQISGGVEGRGIGEIIKNVDLRKAVGDFIKAMRKDPQDVEINEGGRFFSVHVVSLKDKSDFSAMVFFQDITEEKRLETIKKDFVANVSHELRTPLASIKGYSETLLEGITLLDRGLGGIAPLGSDTAKDFLRIIDKHATRMSRLIDDLLILSRLESHQMTLVYAPVDVKELVLSTTAGFRKQAGDKGLKLFSDMPDGLPKVSCDKDRIEQVVVNLLDNAIKYTPPGGSVKVSAVKSDGFVTVDVADTGIGIPADDMPRIFERFYRVDKARSREMGGTGLGLAIVKHIINIHNGRLNVESRPGKGSTFSFSIKAVA
ncbi:MAG: PAS domain-containing sensor histidine kinase [Deltaproteobacteria bacterium]|nr:PAS domain-containing sensor histidine kinase [Deltaproteobacteria bacterium]